MSLGTWGALVFEVTPEHIRTWQEMRRSGEARWHTHDVHGAKPKREFIGPGDDTMSLQVRLDAALGVDPSDELVSLRSARDAGEVRELQFNGVPVFDCYLRSISEEHKRHDAAGRLLHAVVDLSFEEYA